MNTRPTEFCGIELEHPIINGSGTFDVIAGRRAFGAAVDQQFPFSAFVSKTITVEPRAGNPPPRLWELGNGMINSIGLPNKGLAGFIEHDLPELSKLSAPLFVSVMGFDADQLMRLVEQVGSRDQVSAIELNFSCPNVKTGTIVGADPGEMQAMVASLRPLTSKPLIAKLTPMAASVAEVARAAEASGIDSISLTNTLPGMALSPRNNAEPWLGGGTGGVSGAAIREVSLAQVAVVAKAVSLPVIGMGGVENVHHANDLFAVGARLVAVGTANFRDPNTAKRISDELDPNP